MIKRNLKFGLLFVAVFLLSSLLKAHADTKRGIYIAYQYGQDALCDKFVNELQDQIEKSARYRITKRAAVLKSDNDTRPPLYVMITSSPTEGKTAISIVGMYRERGTCPDPFVHFVIVPSPETLISAARNSLEAIDIQYEATRQ